MYSIFETEITVRPDDIDMNNHVHYSRYLDYILMARYDQMKNDYKVALEEFGKRGFSWVASEVNIQYKRPIFLEDGTIKVRTQLEEFHGAKVMINFWMVKGENEKIAAQGKVSYTMIAVKSGRPTRVPEDIVKQYQL
jgi:YbgC/YbaW family acyl-CoA thioester hydrolase